MNSIQQNGSKRKTILQIARTWFNERDGWRRQTEFIFSRQNFMVFMKNDGGWATITAFLDAPRLSERKYSRPLAVGYFDPGARDWVESSNVFEDYETWQAEIKRTFFGGEL